MNAAAIVDEIIADLTDRRGLRQEWEEIDPAIREEIRQTWIGIVEDGATDQQKGAPSG